MGKIIKELKGCLDTLFLLRNDDLDIVDLRSHTEFSNIQETVISDTEEVNNLIKYASDIKAMHDNDDKVTMNNINDIEKICRNAIAFLEDMRHPAEIIQDRSLYITISDKIEDCRKSIDKLESEIAYKLLNERISENISDQMKGYIASGRYMLNLLSKSVTVLLNSSSEIDEIVADIRVSLKKIQRMLSAVDED